MTVMRSFKMLLSIVLLTIMAAGGPAFAVGTAVAAQPVKILALGTSLTQGYGLPPGTEFTVQLQAALKRAGIDAVITNAGVSADTSAGGLARLDWSVPKDTDAVILELGANDMLRGFDPKVTRDALAEIVRRLKARNIEVLLCGMRAARNLGPGFVQAFDPIYPELAAANDLLLYPFFLEGVVADPKLNIGDGVHPTAEGVARIVSGILPKVEALLARVRAKPAS